MKRALLFLLLAVAFLSLQVNARAQEKEPSVMPPPGQSQSPSADDYGFRLTLFVVEKIDRSTDNPSSDPLAQAANELFAADKQEQIRRELERKIGAPGDPKRAARYEKLLSKIDVKLSAKKIGEMREELARKGRGSIAGWAWPLCVTVGCK
jgi:hypothetical protein